MEILFWSKLFKAFKSQYYAISSHPIGLNGQPQLLKSAKTKLKNMFGDMIPDIEDYIYLNGESAKTFLFQKYFKTNSIYKTCNLFVGLLY